MKKKQKRFLTFEDMLAVDDRPAAVKAGRPGRPQKWRLVDIAPERVVATEVDMLRCQQGIDGNRTPEWIFVEVGAKHGISARSARRHYMTHREHGRLWAQFIRMNRSYKKIHAELVEVYGEEVGDLPAPLGDRIYEMRESTKISELSTFDAMVRKIIIGQKQRKT